AILHLDVGLGEEAEDLGEQAALGLVDLLRPVAAVRAQLHFLGHPVDLLLALPIFERPGVFERLVLLGCDEKGHWSGLSDEEDYEFERGEDEEENGDPAPPCGDELRDRWV